MRHFGLEVGIREERLRAQARGRVLDLAAEPRWMTRDDLEPHGYDTIVSVLQFCGVHDFASACARLHALLAEGGRLLLLEHVRAVGWRGRIQAAVSPAWRRASGGCCVDRDTIWLLREHGFAVTDCERFELHGATPLLRHAVSAVAIRRVRNEVDA